MMITEKEWAEEQNFNLKLKTKTSCFKPHMKQQYQYLL